MSGWSWAALSAETQSRLTSTKRFLFLAVHPFVTTMTQNIVGGCEGSDLTHPLEKTTQLRFSCMQHSKMANAGDSMCIGICVTELNEDMVVDLTSSSDQLSTVQHDSDSGLPPFRYWNLVLEVNLLA